MSSDYAYQIALKTLKERCDYLQNKLDYMEEENCRLKLQIPDDSVKRTSSSVEQLNLQITLLTEQKAKLNRRVQLISTENQKLWSRLSELTANEMKVEEDRLKYIDGLSYSESHSDLEISKEPISRDDSRESLEEISLKINALIMDKRDFPSTLDLYVYKNPLQMENCAFSSSDNIQVLNSVKNHIIKLKQFRQILNNNKNDLTSAITLFKNFKKNNVCNECGKTFTNHCRDNSTVLSNAVGVEEVNDLATLEVSGVAVAADPDNPIRVCPLCAATISGLSEEFFKHVSGHFSDDEHEFTHTFEMVP